jgi:hypothetical protein
LVIEFFFYSNNPSQVVVENATPGVVEVYGESKLFTLEPVHLEQQRADKNAEVSKSKEEAAKEEAGERENDRDKEAEEPEDTSATGSNEIRVEEGRS